MMMIQQVESNYHLSIHNQAMRHRTSKRDGAKHQPSNFLPPDLVQFYYTQFYSQLIVEMRRAPDPRKEFLMPHRGMKIADIGCGDGSMMLPLLAENEVYGVDIHPDVSDAIIEAGLIPLHQDLNLGLPGIPPASFDAVYSFDVIEHIFEPEQLFAEMVRILKPGGMLILTTPIYQEDTWESNYKFHLDKARNASISEEEISRWMRYEPEVAIFDLESLLKLLDKNQMSLLTRAIGYSFDEPNKRIEGLRVHESPNVLLYCVKETSRIDYLRDIARGWWSPFETCGRVPYPLQHEKQPGDLIGIAPILFGPNTHE